MTTKSKTIFKSITKWLSWIFLSLLVLTGGVYLWAWCATDANLIARGIMWGDSDAGDLYRFSIRTMRASTEPVKFERVNDELQIFLDSLPISNDDIGIVDMPFNEYLEYTNTTAFIVLHGDQLLYEGYFNGADRESMQTSFSVAKSFTSTLVGVAVEEGFIDSLDDSITIYLPELSARDKRFEAITLRHLNYQ